jgi:ABC-type sugar transport system permease subunit
LPGVLLAFSKGWLSCGGKVVGKKAVPYIMLAPFFVIYFVFNLFPLFFSLGISFSAWDGFNETVFVKFENYIRLFTRDKFFYQALFNTVLLLCFNTPVVILAGLLAAVFLKDFFRRTKGAIQLINFLPCITTPVAVGLLFQLMFDVKTGVVNGFLSLCGLEPYYWLGYPWSARMVVVIMTVWNGYGYMMIMLTAGLTTISDELYEAATIDGSSWLNSFFKITIPMLRPIFAFIITTSIINGLKLFDEPSLLFVTSGQQDGAFGGPDRSVLTVVMRFYEVSFRQFEFGYGSAMAYILFIIIAFVSFFSVRLLNRDNQA